MIGNWDSEGFRDIRSDTAVCRAGMAIQPCWTFLRLMNIHLTVYLISGILLHMLISFLLSHLTLCTKPFDLCFGSWLRLPPLEILFWSSKWEGHPIFLCVTATAATICHLVVFLILSPGYLFSFCLRINCEFLRGMDASILGFCPSHIVQCVAHSKCAVNMYWTGK